MRTLLILAVVAFIGTAVEGKKFSQCALVKELLKHGIPKSEMSNWICLIEHESGYNTKATHRNTDGSIDYGLFQINNRYWCNSGSKAGKDCHVTCAALLSDNINASVQCAKLIKRRMGWRAWYGWLNHCNGKRLPNVNHCY